MAFETTFRLRRLGSLLRRAVSLWLGCAFHPVTANVIAKAGTYDQIGTRIKPPQLQRLDEDLLL